MFSRSADLANRFLFPVGKTKILRSLNKTYINMKRKPIWQDLNPKAVTNDELFGYINPATREWKDGKKYAIIACSVSFRPLSLSFYNR